MHELGYVPPDRSVALEACPITRLDRAAVVDLVLRRLGARQSAWNAADIRGEVEKTIAAAGIIADGTVRRELAEDLTSRTVASCTSLLDRADVPEHVRSLSSKRVVHVEEALVSRLAIRGRSQPRPVRLAARRLVRELDAAQRRAVAAIAGTAPLIVIEGAAGAGKTTALAAADGALRQSGRRLLVVTPTLKAARVASRESKAPASSAHWLAIQHGFRWDADGHFGRVPVTDRIRLGPVGLPACGPETSCSSMKPACSTKISHWL